MPALPPSLQCLGAGCRHAYAMQCMLWSGRREKGDRKCLSPEGSSLLPASRGNEENSAGQGGVPATFSWKLFCAMCAQESEAGCCLLLYVQVVEVQEVG